MEIMPVNELTAVADSGYCSEAELAAYETAGATAYVPIPDKHKVVNGQGCLSGKSFQYNRTHDVFTFTPPADCCPSAVSCTGKTASGASVTAAQPGVPAAR